MRAEGLALDEIGLRDIVRHENVGFETGERGVGCQSAGRVAGRRDGEFSRTEFLRHGDGGGQAARFEGIGGIAAFVLHPERREAELAGEPVGSEQRRPAFLERDEIRRIGWQNRRVTPHAGGRIGERGLLPGDADGRQVVANEQRTAAAAQIRQLPGFVPRVAAAAVQECWMTHACHGKPSISESRFDGQMVFFSTFGNFVWHNEVKIYQNAKERPCNIP